MWCRFFYFYGTFVSFIFLSILGESNVYKKSLDLKRCLELGLENSLTLKQLEIEISSFGLEIKKEKATLRPSLSSEASVGIKHHHLNKKKDYDLSSLSFNLDYPLYDNGQSFIKENLLLRRKKKLELKLVQEKNKIISEITFLFLDISLEETFLKSSQEEFVFAERNFKVLSQQYQEGLKSYSDYLTGKANLQRKKVQLESLKFSLSQKKNSFFSLLSKDSFTLEIFSLESLKVPIWPSSLDFSSFIEIKIEQLETQNSQDQIILSEKKTFPELALSFGGKYNTQDFFKTSHSWQENQAWEWSALFTVKYPLWDWNKSAYDVEIMTEKKRSQEYQEKKILEKIKNESEKLRLQFEENLQLLKLAKELWDLEKQRADSIKISYQNGKSPLSDWLLVEKEKLEAEGRYLAALISLQKNYYSLLQLQGNLHEILL